MQWRNIKMFNHTKNNYLKAIRVMPRTELQKELQETELNLLKGKMFISKAQNPYGSKQQPTRINIKLLKWKQKQLKRNLATKK